MFHYRPGNLKQRICAVFDDKYASQIVQVEENTYALSVTGFVGKPESAKKTRGEQYIFVNHRFIKSAYLNHAIQNAYDQMIGKDTFPFYVLFLDIDPKRIDINVHPQKYEIKFDDEKLAYTFVNLAVKHALGAYSVMPSLDFNQEDHLNRNGTFDQVPDWLKGPKGERQGTRDEVLNPATISSHGRKPDVREKSNIRNWETVFQTEAKTQKTDTQQQIIAPQEEDKLLHKEVAMPYQLHHRYIVSHIKSGFILIDQQAAHERILFERFIMQLAHNNKSSQRQLFPQSIDLNAEDTEIMHEVLHDINALGFDIQEFGKQSFVIHSFPAETNDRRTAGTIQKKPLHLQTQQA